MFLVYIPFCLKYASKAASIISPRVEGAATATPMTLKMPNKTGLDPERRSNHSTQLVRKYSARTPD